MSLFTGRELHLQSYLYYDTGINKNEIKDERTSSQS